MAEANFKHGSTNETEHKDHNEKSGNRKDDKGYTKLCLRNKNTGDETQNTNYATESPYVYRNYGAVKLKPLVLRNHHWSTKDIKERFPLTAKSNDVRQEKTEPCTRNLNASSELLSKSLDIPAASARFTAHNPNHDEHVIKPLGNRSNEAGGDATDNNVRHARYQHGDTLEQLDENQITETDKSIVDQNTDSATNHDLLTRFNPQNIQLDLTQSKNESNVSVENIEIGQSNHDFEVENSEEMKSVCVGPEENATVNPNEGDENSFSTRNYSGPNQICNNAHEEVSNDNQGETDDPALNATANDNDENERATPGNVHSNIDADASREEHEANDTEAAENQNRSQDSENAEGEQRPQDGQQQQGEDTNTDSTTETEKEAWTQEEIQALLRKAINLHASERDLKTVIRCGGDVNKPIQSGLHPLHYAAYTDYPECIELLLNFGANVNCSDDIGYTPLHLAARRGNHLSMEVLIENGAIINYSEPGVEIHQSDERNKLGYTTMEPINLAVQNGHPKCARLLLEKGARPNNKYFMGYEICLAPLDNPECLELLLEFGADPNVFNRCGLSPLMKACKDHHIEAVRKLIKHGADVNAVCPPLFEQKSVLQFAITSGNIVITNILLGKGAKITRHSEYKYCALHTAVIKGRADICRLLLQHGADANERTDEGATPMMLACSTPELIERREIVQLLLDCGADINAHSPGYSYFDPYLAPLTEYFKCIENREGFGIVRLMIRNGAIIHFSNIGLEMELKRLRDPFSIVQYVHCLKNNPPMFEFVVSAATKYNPLLIYAARNIPEDMKDSLIYTATRPRELKHLVRVSLRSQLTPGLPDKVEKLPLPSLLKAYLLFR